MSRNPIVSQPIRDSINEIVSESPIVVRAREIRKIIRSEIPHIQPDVDIPTPSEKDFKAKFSLVEQVNQQYAVLQKARTIRIILKAPEESR